MQNCELGPLDHFFAKKTLEKAGEYTEERALFLARLMQTSRQGHLCWHPKEAPSFPSSVTSSGEVLCPKTPVVFDGGRYYLQRNWVYETYLLAQVERLKAYKPAAFYDRALFVDSLLKCVEEGKLLPEQEKAIDSAFENPFSIICGGPGTGKTYTAALFVRLLLDSLKGKKTFKLVLTAPTGKAASHLQAVLLGHGNLGSILKVETATLHRLLRLQPGENRLFQKKRIDADLVLVDEASMLDASLLAHLFEAIGDETRLLLLGDPDQLPPIDSGSLFPEMALLFGSHLKRSMRTEASDLQRFAGAILENDSSKTESLLRQGSASLGLVDWAFDASLGEKLFQVVEPVISKEKPDPEKCLRDLNRFRILGSLRQGMFGVDELNRQILNGVSRRIQQGQWWAVPILVTSNEPRLDLYNGSCGVLIGKSSGGVALRQGIAYFPDFEKGGVRSFSALPPFEVAFCLSIHKSQGSEFEKVLALFPPGSESFGREAIYTAATRAKKELRLIGDLELLKKMTERRSLKMSGFAERYKTPKKNFGG